MSATIFNAEKFDAEKEKIKWMVGQGLLDRYELDFFLRFYGFNEEEVLPVTPKLIIARPTKFSDVAQVYSSDVAVAQPADPYSGVFPVVSLISLEKAINAIANLKIPWKKFEVIVTRSYYDIPPVAMKLLLEMALLLNNHGYNVSLINESTKNVNYEAIRLPEDLNKVLCHLKKKLEKAECDDSEWFKYNLWGRQVSQVDTTKIRKIAIELGLPITAVKYIILAKDTPSKLEAYKKSFNLSDEIVKAIINRYQFDYSMYDVDMLYSIFKKKG